MDCLGWSDNAAAQLVMEGYVKLTQPGELLLTTTRSRGRTLKWQNVWMGLVTLNHHQVWGFAFIIHFPSKHSNTLSLSFLYFAYFFFLFSDFLIVVYLNEKIQKIKNVILTKSKSRTTTKRPPTRWVVKPWQTTPK